MPNYFNPYQYPQAQYPQNYYQQQIQNGAPAPVQQNVQPMPESNFVPAPSEDFARNYPVGYGKSVNFKAENAPYIYVKTMGFSQLDNPIFEKYRLVKEEPTTPQNGMEKSEEYKLSFDELKAEIEDLRGQIEDLREKVNALSERSKTKSVKKEVTDDDE